MADVLSSLKKIQEQVNKLVESLEPKDKEPKEPKEPKEKKPKEPKEPKAPKEKKPKDKEPKEEKPEKVEKNIPRLTPTIAQKLQKVVEEVCDWDDKFKKEFAEYANTMTKDDYAAKPLEEHIEDFALSKRGPSGGSGAKPAPALEITELTYKELKELKGLSNTDDPLVFKTKQGKLVTGPPELDDEDMEEGTFESAEILIGEKTRRVYNSDEEFMGWWGFGKFKDADM